MPNGEKSSSQDRQLNEAKDTPGRTQSGSTEQQSAAEISARAAQRLSVLGEMTEGIAHDFRNILAVIDSGLRLAENKSNDPKAASTFIAGAREGVARGLTLTSQLLTFAKQREFQAHAADANKLLKALELFLRYGAGSEVRVVLELSPNIPICLIDPSQFNAAILNLVINARDAMPKGGEVRISTTPWVVQSDASDATPGNYVRVRVRDNGVGMPDEVLQKIFQPFFTTKGEQGTGLGVPQVGTFMHHIGGHVRVASGLGRGTTFDLFFLAVDPNAAHARRIDVEVTPSMHSVDELSSGRLSSMAELQVL
jgi:signal transduction histidine kinase